MSRDDKQVPALILALGLVIASLVAAHGLGQIGETDRFVEVKGFAEREVPADLAIWPISYSTVAEDLDALRAELDRADEAVVAFLKLNGFTDAEINRNPPRVTDRWLHAMPGQRPTPRYSAERTLTLRSTQVTAVRQAMGDAAELISQGVTLKPDWGASTEFLFTALEDIKPEMIAEATADARAAANRFAEDSGASVGAIRRARQGYFTINPIDPSSPHIKKVRVVTTIEYDLNS